MDPECSSGYISGAAVLGLKRGSVAVVTQQRFRGPTLAPNRKNVDRLLFLPTVAVKLS